MGSMVIKVKYGDTLRRFNAVVDEYGSLQLSMTGLRSKILDLFNLAPNADITMKYVDEDGDLVTLAEDEDLHDVMRQRLKFLRIFVQVNTGKGPSSARSIGTSTPLNTIASLREALKLKEETLKEIVDRSPAKLAANFERLKLLKLSQEMGQSLPRPLSMSQTGASSVSKASLGGSTLSTVKEPSIDDVTKDKGKSQCNPAPKPSASAGLGWTSSKECPFSGAPLGIGSTVPRRFGSTNLFGCMIHKGICCDGCGVHPITGPRYKSKVREDYDLCGVCFGRMGNEGDYVIMDRPVSYPHPRKCNAIYDHTKNAWNGSFPTISAKTGLKSLHPRLDSHFISDITVMDGTMMAPSTPFTKIWRMHNNGNFAWLRGTKLVWIGGDKFTDVVSVELEVPESGVPSDGQVDIAVDFTAPEVPGRYVSHWKMSSASGRTFGERVWVCIQVDSSLQDSVSDSLGGLNLNLPPDGSDAKSPVMLEESVFESTSSKNEIDESPKHDHDAKSPVKLEESVSHGSDGDGLFEPTSSNEETDSLNPVVSEESEHDHDVNFPINDGLLVGHGPSAPLEPIAALSGHYHVVESPASDEDNVVEQTMLKELEEMGFKQAGLNKEILRINEYSLEQSVDQLCSVGEWDPMLEELEEMGFCNTEVNKMLLEKNNGSIKRVVMDLINRDDEHLGSS